MIALCGVHRLAGWTEACTTVTITKSSQHRQRSRLLLATVLAGLRRKQIPRRVYFSR